MNQRSDPVCHSIVTAGVVLVMCLPSASSMSTVKEVESGRSFS